MATRVATKWHGEPRHCVHSMSLCDVAVMPCHCLRVTVFLVWRCKHAMSARESLPRQCLRGCNAMLWPACLLSHPAMSPSCQLYEPKHTWRLCRWRHVFQPRVTWWSYYAVVNHFRLWQGVHVVDEKVLSSSHQLHMRLIRYSFTTTRQSLICPT